MWVRGTFLLLFAFLIDAAQIVAGWMFLAIGTGLQLITPAGGAVGGAAAGAYLCWDTTPGVIAGIITSAKCAVAGAGIGAVASAFGVPIGEGLSFIVDICLSLTLGSGLIMALIMCGMFYPKYVWSGSIVEYLPFFDMIPGWTMMVILSIMEKSKEKGGVLGTAAGVALAVQSPSFKNITSSLSGVKNATIAMQSNSRLAANDDRETLQKNAQPALQTKNFDGITKAPAPRAANDNLRPYVQKAA